MILTVYYIFVPRCGNLALTDRFIHLVLLSRTKKVIEIRKSQKLWN